MTALDTLEPAAASAEFREISFREALKEALVEEFQHNPDLFVMGEDLLAQGGVFGVHQGLEVDYRDRFLETPISEAAIIGTAVGVALTGGAVVAELMFSDFITCCMDEIVNQAAKMRYMSGGQANVPLTIRTPCGMGLGVGAPHTQCFESWFSHVPGLKVVVPSTPADAKGLLKTAIRSQDPVIFLEYKKLYPTKGLVSSDTELLIPFGKARIHRPGSDLTIAATGHMVLKALEAAETLAAQGISAEIIDPRTVSPLDMDAILASVEKTSRLIVCDESTITCSVASEIAATVSDRGFYFLDAPVKRVCSPEVPKPFSPSLEPLSVPQVGDILAAARDVLN
jgi:pyruvate dehydrogenase E1 component beta subunit